jgi:glycosyltransferase 2 family protein
MGTMDKNLDTEKKAPKYEEHEHVLAGWRFTALIVTVIVSVIGYFLLSLWGGWDKVIDGFAKIGFLGVGVCLSIAFISYLFRFTRWNYFLHTLGHYVPWLKSLRIYISGFSLTTTPGKAGEAIRSVFLVDYGIAYRRSFGALLAERLSDFLAVVLLAMGGLLVHPAAWPVIIFSVLFIIGVLYTVQQDHWLKSIENWTNRKLKNRFAHIVEFIIETVLAFRSCFKTHVLIYGTVLGAIAWGLEGVILYFVLHMLGAEVSIYTAIFIHAFSLLIGAITLLPGGLGGAEVAMYELLIYNDVTTSVAVTATLVVRLCTLWFSVLLGLALLPKKQIKLR